MICEKDAKLVKIAEGVASRLNLGELYFLLEFSRHMDHHLFTMMVTILSHDKDYQHQKETTEENPA